MSERERERRVEERERESGGERGGERVSSRQREREGERETRGGGVTLIISYIRRLGLFFGVQNSEFQYFFGFSEK